MCSPRIGAGRLAAICLTLIVGLASAQNENRRQFGKGNPFTVNDLPAGTLKTQLLELSPQARGKAMKWLHSFKFGELDAAHHLRADNSGGIYIVCNKGPVACKGCGNPDHNHGGTVPLDDATQESSTTESAETLKSGEEPTVSGASVPISNPPAYNSKPGAPNVIYLDFNGGIVSGTNWNSSRSVSSWDTQAWSRDTDRTTFSDSEQVEIRQIWERMSEDFAPFDVNVSTDTAYDPDIYTGDRSRVAWCLFTPPKDKNGVSNPHDGSGGIAYVGVFGRSDFANYSPAWCLDYAQANAAEVGSHEIGHNLGLSHDGTSAVTYYSGHGSGDISWGPIMGTGYGDNVSQWSKGDYYDANQTQDDLTIMEGKLTYRTDDHGDSSGTATVISPAGNGTFSNSGIIERTGETDVFSFETGSGTVTLNANPYRTSSGTRGGNLDILLELYDSGGTLIASNNGATVTDASISTTLSAGTYFVHVKPSSAGNASGTGSPYDSSSSTRQGYSIYGSLGQYTLSGSLILPGVALTESDGSTSVAEGGATDSYTLVLGTQPSADVTITISPDAQLTTNKSSVVFTSANWDTPQTVTVTAVDDSLDEGPHQGIVSHTSSSSDQAFNGIEVASVIANVADNDNVEVVSPNGGEIWYTGFDTTITWDSQLGGNVEIKLLKNGSDYLTINSSTPNDGSHVWNVPRSVATAADYTVRITHTGTSRNDVSNATFSIAEGPIYYANMDTDPGWTLGTGWAYGQPTGQGQDAYGSPDPSSGQNGANVIGYNLNGDYEGGISSTRWATTPAIDCSDYTGVQLEFQRWLGVEGGYDNAYIQVSNDGTNWTLVWENSNTNGTNDDDGAWVPVSYDISAVADGQATVYVRWGMGTTDGSWNFCGWNLDEVILSGVRSTPSAGATIAESGGSTDVTEGGATDSYTMVLNTQPTADVTITISPDVETTVSPTSLTFTSANWDQPQSVTVTAFDDTDHELAHTGIITHSTSSSDAEYQDVFIENVVVNVTDDDNSAPSIYAGADKSMTLTESQPWTPAEISTQLWLDASDSSTITLNGSAVSQWSDKSGNNRHAVQGTASAQPALTGSGLNGLDVVTFDGSADFFDMGTGLDFLAGVSHSAFIVTKTTAYGNIYGAANGSSGSNSLHVGFRDSASYRMNYWGNDWYGTIASPFVAGEANMLNYVWLPGTSKQIFANATSQGTSSNAGNIGTMAGGGRIGRTTGHPFYGGDIAEIIMLTGTVSAEDKQRLEGYLAHKWGLTNKLPAGHPYKTDPPGGAGFQGQVVMNDATASDPDLDPITTSWSVVSGPAEVTFDDPTSVNATATFTMDGTYTLRLTGTDGVAPSSDDVIINVDPPSSDRTLTYNGNGNTGGTVPEDPNSPYADNSTVTVLGNTGTLVRTGYTYAGWNTAADGSGDSYVRGNAFTITKDTVLYAQWVPNSYTVTFDKQSGAGGSDNVAATYGSPMPAATPPTRSGFAFAGYYTGTNGTGTRYYDGLMNSTRNWDIASNVTLYAKWANAYTVTFQTDGTTGSSLTGDTSQVVAENNDCTAVTANTPAGHYFVNWTESGVEFSTNNPLTVTNVTSDLTLTANFALIPSIAIADDGLIAEGSENGEVITVTLIDGVFASSINAANWTVSGLPAGVTKGSVTRLSDTTVGITLSGTRTVDYDSDITGVSVSCAAAEVVDYGSPLSANSGVTLTAADDAEFIEISDDGWIEEGAEDTEIITVVLHGGTFASSLNDANWTVSNLPAGVSKGIVTRVSAQVATISLSGNRTATYGGTDITNVSVSCTTAEYSDNTGGATLSATSGVTLRALNGGTLVLQQGLDSYAGAADTFINKASSTTNYGTATTLDFNVHKNQVRYGLLRYDLSGIPAGSTITAAALDFTSGGGELGTVEVYSTTGAWDASTATWDSSNAIVGNTLYGSATMTDSTLGAAVPSISIDPAIIQDWVDTPGSNNGMSIKSNYTSGNGANVANLCSSDHGTQANRPKLTITYESGGSGAPEMTVQGQTITINSGDTTPNTADDTDFGSLSTDGSSDTHTFTIRNHGDAALNLNGSPLVQVTGTNASDFTVTADPATSVAGGGSTTFQLTFSPSGGGVRNATISIANDDVDEGAYTFAVSGVGVGTSSSYDTWAGGPGFSEDSNGDGIANGLAWALGASSISSDVRDLMPVVDADSEPGFLIFNYRRLDDANNDTATTFAVEYGTTLGAWAAASHDGTDTIITEYNDDYGTGVDRVEVKLRKSAHATGGKLFSRLKVTRTP